MGVALGVGMLHRPTERSRTWMTVACLAVGVQGGHALATLALDEPELPALTEASSDVEAAEPDVPTSQPEPRRVAWCSRPALCFVDLDELGAQLAMVPRGMRLVPEDGGLRIDGARGLLTLLGLRNGDVLLAVDDQSLQGDGSLALFVGTVERGGFSLRYRRGGRVFAKRVNFVVS